MLLYNILENCIKECLMGGNLLWGWIVANNTSYYTKNYIPKKYSYIQKKNINKNTYTECQDIMLLTAVQNYRWKTSMSEEHGECYWSRLHNSAIIFIRDKEFSICNTG